MELAQWRDREVSLVGQSFLTARTPLFLHVPRRFHLDLEALAAQLDGVRYKLTGAPMVLHRDGWFSGEVLISVDHAAAGAPPVETFHNLFYSRVVEKPGFDAALREMPRFYRDLRAAQVGRMDAMYFWYLNCPKCLLEQGARQIILLARSTKVLATDACPAGAVTRGQFLPCGV
jgi:hypothetical protein